MELIEGSALLSFLLSLLVCTCGYHLTYMPTAASFNASLMYALTVLKFASLCVLMNNYSCRLISIVLG
jgi:hypothetical protein